MPDPAAPAGPSNTPSETAPAVATPPASNTSLLTPPAEPTTQATTDPASTDPAKATEPTQVTAPVVPEKYEFKTPDDVQLDPKVVDAYAPAFKELGLTQEQAQKLVDLNVKQYQDAMRAHQEGIQREQEQQLQDSRAQFSQDDIATAQSAVAAFGGKDFVSLMEEKNAQNHPAVIRLFRNIGRRIGEDSFQMDGSNIPTKRTPAEVLYPNQTKQ